MFTQGSKFLVLITFNYPVMLTLKRVWNFKSERRFRFNILFLYHKVNYPIPLASCLNGSSLRMFVFVLELYNWYDLCMTVEIEKIGKHKQKVWILKDYFASTFLRLYKVILKNSIRCKSISKRTSFWQYLCIWGSIFTIFAIIYSIIK